MKSISLKTFLISLIGNEELVVKYLSLHDKRLQESVLSFSYFQNWQEEITDIDIVLQRCLIRGSAIQLKNEHRGADLLIPLILSDNQLSFLAIQVKLRREGFSISNATSFQNLIEKLDPSYLFPYLKTKFKRPYAGICINVYQGSASTIILVTGD